MKTKMTFFLALCLTCVLITSCADANTVVNTPGQSGNIAGFWSGLWHGFTILPSWIISLFNNVNIYEVHNNGGWYNFGFFLGQAITLGGAAKASQ